MTKLTHSSQLFENGSPKIKEELSSQNSEALQNALQNSFVVREFTHPLIAYLGDIDEKAKFAEMLLERENLASQGYYSQAKLRRYDVVFAIDLVLRYLSGHLADLININIRLK